MLVTDLDPPLEWQWGVMDYEIMVELKIWFQAQVRFPNLYIIYY
jgi:hypothetical protein